MNSIPKVIIIQGPTASGKSSLAEKLAQEINAEIISADSRQVYQYLDIGTAKPDANSQKKVKYHLIDIIKPDQVYNAGLFVCDAHKAIEQIVSRGKIPMIVGGTGFYISSFLNGLAVIPPIDNQSKQAVADFIKTNTPEQIYQRVESIDPIAAARINANDLHRLQRALEVFESTKTPLSSWWQKEHRPWEGKFLNILLSPPRPQLYRKINSRIDQMMELGLLKEIDNLFKMGYKESDPGMISVGYREFYPWIRGEYELETALELARQHTRNYAKRQLTWYRKQIFDLTNDTHVIKLSILGKKIREFLKGE